MSVPGDSQGLCSTPTLHYMCSNTSNGNLANSKRPVSIQISQLPGSPLSVDFPTLSSGCQAVLAAFALILSSGISQVASGSPFTEFTPRDHIGMKSGAVGKPKMGGCIIPELISDKQRKQQHFFTFSAPEEAPPAEYISTVSRVCWIALKRLLERLYSLCASRFTLPCTQGKY